MAIASLVRERLSSQDEVLKQVIETIPVPEIVSTQNVFHDLMSCVIEQQIHYRSTKKVFQKMLDAASLDTLSPNNFETFEEKAFSSVKLSGQKYQAIHEILGFFEKNDPDWQALEDKDVKKLLNPIKGVSHWTSDMILLYTLEREDVFPSDDYHVKQVMTKLYPLGPSSKIKAQMKAVAGLWSPYKSWAVKYLLAWKTFQKQK